MGTEVQQSIREFILNQISVDINDYRTNASMRFENSVTCVLDLTEIPIAILNQIWELAGENNTRVYTTFLGIGLFQISLRDLASN